MIESPTVRREHRLSDSGSMLDGQSIVCDASYLDFEAVLHDVAHDNILRGWKMSTDIPIDTTITGADVCFYLDPNGSSPTRIALAAS